MMNLGDEYFLLTTHKKQFIDKYANNPLNFAHQYLLHLYNCEADRIILKSNKKDLDQVANIPSLSRIMQVQELWKELMQNTTKHKFSSQSIRSTRCSVRKTIESIN